MLFSLRFPRFFPSAWLKTLGVSVDHQHDLLGTSSSSAMPEGGEAKGWRVDANKSPNNSGTSPTLASCVKLLDLK